MKLRNVLLFLAALAALAVAAQLAGSPTAALPEKPVRARDLGIPFDGMPGPLNAITDVKGVEVGFTTLIEGEGALVVGKGQVRTGVTVIFPRGKTSTDSVMAAPMSSTATVK